MIEDIYQESRERMDKTIASLSKDIKQLEITIEELFDRLQIVTNEYEEKLEDFDKRLSLL